MEATGAKNNRLHVESGGASIDLIAIAEPFESTIESFQSVEREDQAPGPGPSLRQGHRPSSSVVTTGDNSRRPPAAARAPDEPGSEGPSDIAEAQAE